MKKFHLNRKQKLDALHEITRKKVTGKGTSEPGRPQKVDNPELVEGIFRTAILSSARAREDAIK